MKFLNLAKKNRAGNPESWEHLYKSTVIRKIRIENDTDENEELAIHRKVLMALVNVMQTMHGGDIDAEELKALDAMIERCKAEVAKEMAE